MAPAGGVTGAAYAGRPHFSRADLVAEVQISCMNRRQTLAALGTAALAPLAMPLSARAADAPYPADLKGDIAILRQALALHPGLYRYATPAQVSARIDLLEREWLTASGLEGRYLALARFLATIRCGHSYPNFFNQKKAIKADLFDRPTRLPFAFRWIDGRMIVTADQSGTGLVSPGTEVRTINGVPARAILARLLPYVRADGHNDAKRAALLSMTGADTIETFDVFYGLVYGAPAGGVHRLAIRKPDGAEARIELPPITLAQRVAKLPPQPEGDGPVWTWQLRDDGIAVLTMPGWALYNSKWNWRAWLSERLDSLGNARGLVVDLRENEGGEDCGDPILARLIDAPLSPAGAIQKLRFERTPPAIDRYLDTWDDSFRTLGVGGKRLADGFIERPGGNAILTIAPAGKPLKLPVAALIGPTNSSATFQFATMARASGKVRLFGETTGGNRRGINGGCFFFVRLPASGLEFDLPLVGYFPTTPQPDAGLDPDVRVASSAADIAKGYDPALASAVDWIAKA